MTDFPEINNDMQSVLGKKMEQRAIDLSKSVKNAGSNEKQQKLQHVAHEFESMFVNLLFKQMRKTIPNSKLIDGGSAEDIFEEMLDSEISKKIAQRGGLGIADALMEQFNRYIDDRTVNVNGGLHDED